MSVWLKCKAVVFIEGNIAVGKSSLVDKIKLNHPEILTIPEPVHLWTGDHQLTEALSGKNILQMFYDKTISAFSFQQFVKTTVLHNYNNQWNRYAVTHNQFPEFILIERSELSQREVFCPQVLNPAELLIFDYIKAEEGSRQENWFNTEAKNIIYLSADANSLQQRIANRGRQGEKGCSITSDYLEELGKNYETFIERREKKGARVLRIDTAENGPEEVYAKAVAYLEGLSAVPPPPPPESNSDEN